jgi:uncharacterized Zn finger protein (UPF0148 family)
MRCETLELKTCCPKCKAPMLALTGLALLHCSRCEHLKPAAPELKRRAGEKISRAELRRLRPDLRGEK